MVYNHIIDSIPICAGQMVEWESGLFKVFSRVLVEWEGAGKAFTARPYVV